MAVGGCRNGRTRSESGQYIEDSCHSDVGHKAGSMHAARSVWCLTGQWKKALLIYVPRGMMDESSPTFIAIIFGDKD